MPRSSPLKTGPTGRLASARSKTGNPMCSQAASAWNLARHGKPPGMPRDQIFKVLAKCRTQGRTLKQAAEAEQAGQGAKAQHLRHRVVKGQATGKAERLERARDLKRQRAERKPTPKAKPEPKLEVPAGKITAPEIARGAMGDEWAAIKNAPTKQLPGGITLKAAQGDKERHEGGGRFYGVSAFKDDKRIGSAFFGVRKDGTFHPDDLYVDEAHRRKGIATAMLDFVKEQGHTAINTNTATKQGRAFLDSYHSEKAPAGVPKPGETITIKRPDGSAVSLQYREDKNGKALLYDDDKAEYPRASVPVGTLRHFVDDLNGVVNLPGKSGHRDVDEVLAGRGHHLGKGNESVAFMVGGKVVKVSTPVPYIPENSHAYLTPQEAMARTVKSAEMQEEMRKAGIPGFQPQEIVKHGDKAFVIRDALDLPDKLSLEQLEEARASVKAMHEAGYVMKDQIQVGIGKDGKVYHFDAGYAAKSADKYDREDDISHLRLLYEKHGQAAKFRGFGPRQVEDFHEAHNRIRGGESLEPEEDLATMVRLREDIIKEQPARAKLLDKMIAKAREHMGVTV